MGSKYLVKFLLVVLTILVTLMPFNAAEAITLGQDEIRIGQKTTIYDD